MSKHGKYPLSEPHYILEGKEPKPVYDLFEWAMWMEENRLKRRLAKTVFEEKYEISTVFLGLNHRFGEGDPLLFETMTFGYHKKAKEFFGLKFHKLEVDWGGDYMHRYSTYDDALGGHRAVCALLEIEVKLGIMLDYERNVETGDLVLISEGG